MAAVVMASPLIAHEPVTSLLFIVFLPNRLRPDVHSLLKVTVQRTIRDMPMCMAANEFYFAGK
jgi:hypothetical protein